MRKLKNIIGVLTFGVLMFSCSSVVEVTDSWKDVKTTSLKDKNIMVMSKTDNEVVRQQFEIDMVESLKEKDITSIESYKIFPIIKLDEELTNEELDNVKKELIENNIDVVMLTVIKDIEEYTKTTTTGSSGYYVSSSPVYYRRGFYRGFYRHYNTIYIDHEPTSTITEKGKKYVLETLVYDLTLPEDNQLLSVVTSVLDNPQTLGTTSQDLSKKIVKELIR
ncbi:hypothetical protein [Pontimicrobium sp. IMCC45349]|uniref:hypothetical protein n=1 Tax=Pontimicrobium sp. IMCC45349 TaxID=3391574 RepID=UPI0039A068D7